MLRRETNHSYENKVGGTKFIVESECPENSKEDMVDAIVNLVKRDLENISGQCKKKQAKVIDFPKTVLGDTETRLNLSAKAKNYENA